MDNGKLILFNNYYEITMKPTRRFRKRAPTLHSIFYSGRYFQLVHFVFLLEG